MLRAIACGALHQAARHREYHASFRGFRIHALRRRAIPGFDDILEVLVSVSFGGMLLERELVATKISSEPEPLPWIAVITI